MSPLDLIPYKFKMSNMVLPLVIILIIVLVGVAGWTMFRYVEENGRLTTELNTALAINASNEDKLSALMASQEIDVNNVVAKYESERHINDIFSNKISMLDKLYYDSKVQLGKCRIATNDVTATNAELDKLVTDKSEMIGDLTRKHYRDKRLINNLVSERDTAVNTANRLTAINAEIIARYLSERIPPDLLTKLKEGVNYD